MFSENGININSSQQKDNFLNNHENNNNNLNNLNSYAKSTTISTSNASSSSNSSSTSFAHQLRILIPNYDDLMDTIRSQQPHSSRAGGGSGNSGMPNDRRNMMMNDRRMMDRQMVRIVLG